MELYGGRISLRRDPGQRRRAGCGCRVSVDIGSYGRHPCRHGCLYCYANPGGGA
jgi:DNA repair photolyase